MINAQHLQNSNVNAKVTSLMQYTHPWWWPKTRQEVLGNQLIMRVKLTNSHQIPKIQGGDLKGYMLSSWLHRPLTGHCSNEGLDLGLSGHLPMLWF